MQGWGKKSEIKRCEKEKRSNNRQEMGIDCVEKRELSP